MVEVFKTSVDKKKQSQRLLKILGNNYPAHKINFDLTDCDKVLRVGGEEIRTCDIIGLVNASGYQCEVLM